MTTSVSFDICRSYLHDYAVDIPNVTQILGYVRSREVGQLSTVTRFWNPDYHGIREFRCLRQVEAFFKKNETFGGDHCREQAKLSFAASEEVCRKTNLRLDVFYTHPDMFGPDLNRSVRRMQGYINKTLGDFSEFLDEVPSLLRVTPGATSSRSLRRSLPHLKVGKRNIVCTYGARQYISLAAEYFGYGKVTFKPTLSNRITFVPKSWKTDRTIACEPDGNVPFQLAFDSFVKSRLRRRGIDLSDQLRNKSMAQEGSYDGEFGKPNYATVDLSAASDTVAFNTVGLLFPDQWYKFLCDFRSSRYKLDDEVKAYHKFSSMGNGTTFPIETLIFASACHAVGAKDYSVYGDDIIIESHLYDELVYLLSFFGFSVNEEKSFHTGPFRESCGGDFYKGIDVTPFYIRTEDRRKATLSHIVNGVTSLGYPGSKLWNTCKMLVRKDDLPLVPFNLSSTSGVWVDPSTSWSGPNTRYHVTLQRAEFRAYCCKAGTEVVSDNRTLFLWFLSGTGKTKTMGYFKAPRVRDLSLSSLRNSKKTSYFSLPPTPIGSRVSTKSHKYVRKWVAWILPSTGVPVHLYGWSDFISSK